MSSRNSRHSVEVRSSGRRRFLAPASSRGGGGAIDTESRPKADGSPTTSPVLVSTVVDMDIARTLSLPSPEIVGDVVLLAAAFVNRNTLPVNGGKHLSGEFR